MGTYTVIGFWTDSHQRFCDFASAPDADSAESACLKKYPSLAICGVISGKHQALESTQHLAFGTDLDESQG